MSQPRLSQIELGKRLPTATEWEALQAYLQVQPQAKPKTLEFPRLKRKWRQTYLLPDSEPEKPLSSRIFAARKRFGGLADERLAHLHRRPDAALCKSFLERATLDSGHELIFWLHILHAGATPHSGSPAKMGFRTHRIVDRVSLLNITDLRFPCLEARLAGMDAVLFPQVTVDVRKACYRLDVLACLKRKTDRVWINIEIDGQGHDPLFDEERQAYLGLYTIRMSTSELASPQFVQILESRLAKLLPSALAS